MDAQELEKIAGKGEDSRTQFKADVESPDGLAAEIVSLLNARGGVVYVGIGDDGEVSGLAPRDVRRINQMVSNVASQHVRNPVSVLTENIALRRRPRGGPLHRRHPPGCRERFRPRGCPGPHRGCLAPAARPLPARACRPHGPGPRHGATPCRRPEEGRPPGAPRRHSRPLGSPRRGVTLPADRAWEALGALPMPLRRPPRKQSARGSERKAAFFFCPGGKKEGVKSEKMRRRAFWRAETSDE